MDIMNGRGLALIKWLMKPYQRDTVIAVDFIRGGISTVRQGVVLQL